MAGATTIKLNSSLRTGFCLGLAGAFTVILLEGAYFAFGTRSALFDRKG